MRAFYGQRDAGRLFWLHLESVLQKNGWKRSGADPCVWSKGTVTDGNLMAIATHVDDIPCFFSREQDAEAFRKYLEDTFHKITCSPKPTQLLGMELKYMPDGIEISQPTFARTLVDRFNGHRQATCYKCKNSTSTNSAAMDTPAADKTNEKNNTTSDSASKSGN